MNIQFATCERGRALEFLQKVYPTNPPTEETAKDLLDLVEADIVRVQDPMMYGSKIEIVPGTNWDEKKREAVVAACKLIHGA